MTEDVRLWLDLLDLNLSVIHQSLVENQPGTSNFFQKYANLMVKFFEQMSQFKDKEGFLSSLCYIVAVFTEVAVSISSHTVDLFTDVKKSQTIEAFFDQKFSNFDDIKDFVSLLKKKINDELRNNMDVFEEDIVITLKPM